MQTALGCQVQQKVQRNSRASEGEDMSSRLAEPARHAGRGPLPARALRLKMIWASTCLRVGMPVAVRRAQCRVRWCDEAKGSARAARVRGGRRAGAPPALARLVPSCSVAFKLTSVYEAHTPFSPLYEAHTSKDAGHTVYEAHTPSYSHHTACMRGKLIYTSYMSLIQNLCAPDSPAAVCTR